MDEKIISIAISIVEHNDPLWTAGCLFSLYGDNGTFIKMVLESEFANQNILVAAYLFSKKYLDDLGIEVEEKIYQGEEMCFDESVSEKVNKR